jgi:hypothetical protein
VKDRFVLWRAAHFLSVGFGFRIKGSSISNRSSVIQYAEHSVLLTIELPKQAFHNAPNNRLPDGRGSVGRLEFIWALKKASALVPTRHAESVRHVRLLVAQGVHWIGAGCPMGRDIAG